MADHVVLRLVDRGLLAEAKRLYDMGFGVHWIKPKSKAPVSSGWADGVRQGLDELADSLEPGYGLGVRLGAASKFPDGTYLANLDVDIKSADPRHQREALELVEKIMPGLSATAPSVATGYGVRFFFRTREPVKSRRLGGSSETVKVLMPTAPVSPEQQKQVKLGRITEEELKAGYRIRGAWELELMSAGKQVVVPPSIHPDTGKGYAWTRPLGDWEALPLRDVAALDGGAADARAGATATPPGGEKPAPGHRFAPAEIDYATDTRFSPHMLAIVFGDGVEDRSAAAFSLSIAMVKAGFSDQEILTVLTDRSVYIGDVAFSHRGTGSRTAAADWARKYCLTKARREADAAAVFAREAVITTGGLEDAAAAVQAKELVRPTADDGRPWQARLKRSGKDGEGAIKPTLENTLLIIRNVVGEAVFRRDTFSGREFYGTDAPWTGARAGKALSDEDAVAIKAWLGPKFGFEPAVGIVFEAMGEIAARNQFNPVQEELLRLPAWDGTPRVDGWLRKHFGAEGPAEYLAQVFRKWLIASITRTFEPGAKFDWLPILEGPQGVGKSVFGAILFGQRYFADWLPNLGDKDAALGLVGHRCVEFAELDRMRRNEIETVKAFVTRQVDVVRPPYGRKSVELHRSVVFFGTTNRERYLQDDTGNRRFLPVKVGSLDFAALERDRDQLWAEALCAYQLGLESTLYLEGEAIQIAHAIQKEKQTEDDSDVMAEVFERWLERENKKPEAERFDLSRFRLVDLFEPMGPFGGYKFEMRNAKAAGRALRKLGAERLHAKYGKQWAIANDPGDPLVTPVTPR